MLTISDIFALASIFVFVFADKWRYKIGALAIWVIVLGIKIVEMPYGVASRFIDIYVWVTVVFLLVGFLIKAVIKKFKSTDD